MKKILFLFSLFVVLLCTACKQPTSISDNETNTESVTPGWYLYTTNANSSQPQTTYLYINSSGTIERAGSSSFEYTGSQLEMLQNQLSYSICKKNANGIEITFTSTEAPSWGTVNNEPDDNATCPYAEGEYLDIYKHWEKQLGIFYWPVNKNLPLWTEGALEYFVTCSSEYGYINGSNIFIAGTNLKEDDEIDFSVQVKIDEYNIGSYYCTVKFTKNTAINDSDDSENGESEITLDTGYEWWCFEKAYLNSGNKENLYVLYFNGEAIRNGIDSYEISEINFLYKEKDSAINNFSGIKYQVMNLTKLPFWCY